MRGGRHPSLLVIDDDVDIRAIVTTVFGYLGFRVDGLSDGIDALRLEKRYDVILLDLNMPIFDGERLTDYWSLTDPEILQRVVVLSGYSSMTRGRTLGAFAALRKPFDMKELLAVVRRCLRAGSGQVSGT